MINLISAFLLLIFASIMTYIIGYLLGVLIQVFAPVYLLSEFLYHAGSQYIKRAGWVKFRNSMLNFYMDFPIKAYNEYTKSITDNLVYNIVYTSSYGILIGLLFYGFYRSMSPPIIYYKVFNLVEKEGETENIEINKNEDETSKKEIVDNT